MLEIGGRSRSARRAASEDHHPRRRGCATSARAERHVRGRDRGVRPAERPRHGARDRRDDPRGEAGGDGRRFGILQAERGDPRHALPRVLPQDFAEARPGPRAQRVKALTITCRNSVLQFPDGQDMLDLLASRGLVSTKLVPLTFGVATLYTGVKPIPESGALNAPHPSVLPIVLGDDRRERGALRRRLAPRARPSRPHGPSHDQPQRRPGL